jgi:hypothetical protein
LYKGDGAKDGSKETKKKQKPTTQYDELQISDDDDFPDEQEILKTTGLLNLKKPAPGVVRLKSLVFFFVKSTFHLEICSNSSTIYASYTIISIYHG